MSHKLIVMKMSKDFQTFKKIVTAICNIETMEEAVERISKNNGAITVTQLNHRPASTIARPVVKSAARAYADVGRY